MKNSTEPQKPYIEAEVYNNNKKCYWEKNKLKSLIGFVVPIKLKTTTEGVKKKGKKNPKESTEQVKT